jgi:hypothetical protein
MNAGPGPTAEQHVQRLLLIVFLAEHVGGLLVFGAGFAVIAVAQNAVLGLLIMGIGLAGRYGLSIARRRISLDAAQQSYYDGGGARWWYDSQSGQVAQGPLAPGPLFDGPYSSRADAERAPEIARERAAAWNAEDDWPERTPPA